MIDGFGSIPLTTPVDPDPDSDPDSDPEHCLKL
jgi:hypothetical protein